MAALSDNIPGATSLVEYLTSPESAARRGRGLRRDAIGRIGGRGLEGRVSRSSPRSSTARTTPINLPSQPGTADVLADFNAQLATLSSTEPATILASVQTSLQDVLDEQ